ncbi:hypothetical protein IAD21_05971 [Abditibacteriota bacterium]|nr:hypothetical protein IAD21_05971 [Abditibacteriota bacterium]
MIMIFPGPFEVPPMFTFKFERNWHLASAQTPLASRSGRAPKAGGYSPSPLFSTSRKSYRYPAF